MFKVIERQYARSLGVYSKEQTPIEAGNDTVHEDSIHSSVVMYWSLSVAVFSIGGMLSSFLVGFVSDFRGRWVNAFKN